MSGLSKERDPAGRVLHDRGTSSKPSPATGVGGEAKPNMKGVQGGGSQAEGSGMERNVGIGKTHLGAGVEELHRQHPHHHSEGGIHHTKDHIRHEPGKY